MIATLMTPRNTAGAVMMFVIALAVLVIVVLLVYRTYREPIRENYIMTMFMVSLIALMLCLAYLNPELDAVGDMISGLIAICSGSAGAMYGYQVGRGDREK